MSNSIKGSLIGLKPEYRERYIVLHKNTFPGVLKRISDSNIRNYSIFLLDNLLFSHMEYVGTDFEWDMAAIGTDEITLNWWKLTDPMQEPLPGRKNGEWWMDIPLVWEWKNSLPGEEVVRAAFTLPDPFQFMDLGQESLLNSVSGLRTLRIFRGKKAFYMYLETKPLLNENHLSGFLQQLIGTTLIPVQMQPVFFTSEIPENKKKKVFVSGCFDMLHSGHVAFFREAAEYGDLYVGIGSDDTVYQLKGRYTVNSQQERKYMIESLACVKQCVVNKGNGIIDFIAELYEFRPDIFIVNEDGHTPAKEKLCEELGIEYKVLKRIPHSNLPVRSTTALRTECSIPFRIDLAGGWLDQPYVSKFHSGAVITISIEPTIEFNNRSGMASSTRRKAIELWRNDIPHGNPEHLAKLLFSFDNPPGTDEIAGSQDALGIVMPGLNRLNYEGGYWPVSILSIHNDDILSWIEQHLYLVTLGPRVSEYSVLENTRITSEGASALAEATDTCWNAILRKDLKGFGKAFTESFESQVAMFPNMADDTIRETIEYYKAFAHGWKLSGAGGGGYLILVAEEPVPDAMQIKIRRQNRF